MSQTQGQALQNLLGMGLQWLSALAAQSANSGANGLRMGIVHDPASGERYLKMPAPEPQILDQMANALDTLAQALRGRSR